MHDRDPTIQSDDSDARVLCDGVGPDVIGYVAPVEQPTRRADPMRVQTAMTSTLAALVLALGGLVPAVGAAAAPGSKITVRISDPTPTAGESFVLRGRFTHAGAAAPGHKVKVQTYRNGRWSMISGGRVVTSSDGRYRVRLILRAEGVRDLRVVGVSDGHHRNAYTRFVVEVH